MAEWQRLIPDAPERLLKMVENQEAHRIASEKRALSNEIVSSYLGTASAFLIGVAAIVLAGFMASQGLGLIGLAAFITALASLAGVYLYGAKSRKDERLRKARIMAGRPELPSATGSGGRH